ncbi:MAG: hypothetical protein WA087_01570, partial [Candidatus Saccharimonadales bacterium]
PGMANSTICNYSTLSFTNAGNNASCDANQSAGGSIGSYAIAQSMPGVAASFPVDTTDSSRNFGNNASIDLSANNLQGIYRATGNNVTINGGVEGSMIGDPDDPNTRSKWIVINAPTADVTINGNIRYTDKKLTSIDQIPQIIIIANNIKIAHNVTKVDAWLVAGEYINTCSTYNNGTTLPIGADLDSNMCVSKLTINGPVMAQKIYLRRTFGSGVGLDHSGDPAEVFNLRADAYLWAAARASSNGQVYTIKTIELPPRF